MRLKNVLPTRQRCVGDVRKGDKSEEREIMVVYVNARRICETWRSARSVASFSSIFHPRPNMCHYLNSLCYETGLVGIRSPPCSPFSGQIYGDLWKSLPATKQPEFERRISKFEDYTRPACAAIAAYRHTMNRDAVQSPNFWLQISKFEFQTASMLPRGLPRAVHSVYYTLQVHNSRPYFAANAMFTINSLRHGGEGAAKGRWALSRTTLALDGQAEHWKAPCVCFSFLIFHRVLSSNSKSKEPQSKSSSLSLAEIGETQW